MSIETVTPNSAGRPSAGQHRKDLPHMNHLGTQELHTPRLTLRQIKPDDARDLFAWMGDPEVCRWERWTPHESADYSRGYIMAVYHYDQIRFYY